MATIRKRNDSYQIRVSCGYDSEGKQVTRTKTWKPDKKMTAKQIEKELNRQAVMFEEACANGLITTSIKFCDFIEQWKAEYAEKNYKQTTLDSMKNSIKRIDEELGHYKLDKISKRTIQEFIKSVSNGTKTHRPLSAKTVSNYLSFVSSMFDYAIRLELVQKNPCVNAYVPAKKRKEREIYTLEEAQLFISTLVTKAPIMYQCYFILAIYGRFRRGELCGLTWDNIDFENHVISINKALYHITGKGEVLDSTKTVYSNRDLKLPDEIFPYLRRLQEHYNSEKERLGSEWHDTDFVFKRDNGTALPPITPNYWLHRFCEQEGLKYVVPHSFRHLNASILINSGASVKTVQASLGHSSASTTLNIYAHPFSKLQAIASEAVASNFKLE